MYLKMKLLSHHRDWTQDKELKDNWLSNTRLSCLVLSVAGSWQATKQIGVTLLSAHTARKLEKKVLCIANSRVWELDGKLGIYLNWLRNLWNNFSVGWLVRDKEKERKKKWQPKNSCKYQVITAQLLCAIPEIQTKNRTWDKGREHKKIGRKGIKALLHSVQESWNSRLSSATVLPVPGCRMSSTQHAMLPCRLPHVLLSTSGGTAGVLSS